MDLNLAISQSPFQEFSEVPKPPNNEEIFSRPYQVTLQDQAHVPSNHNEMFPYSPFSYNSISSPEFYIKEEFDIRNLNKSI